MSEDKQELFPILTNRHGGPVPLLGEDDGTLRNWGLLVGRDATAEERPVLVEADRTLRAQQILWDPNAGPAAPIRWRGETAGEATVALYGEDGAGAIDRLIVNPIQVTSVAPDKRPVEAVAIPNAVADIWTPGLANTVYMDVELEVVNVDGANDAVLEDLGIDYGNDGAAINRYFAREVAMPAGEAGKRFGPYRIWGDDAIMAEADAAARLELHIYILEEGTAL
jgi:hypothetical protein